MSRFRAWHPILKTTVSFGRTVHKIVLRCNTNVPCDWSVRFLCQHIRVSPPERPVGRLPRNHCNSGNFCTRMGFAPTVCGRSLRSDLQSQKPRFGEFGGTSPSTASVCSIVPGQMTTFHRLPGHLRARQAGVSLQVLDWPRLFFSQEVNVRRLTPKVR